MKKLIALIFSTLMILLLLAACSPQAAAATATPTFAFQRSGTRGAGGQGGFATRTPTEAGSPTPSDTPQPTATTAGTPTPYPTDTPIPTKTGLPPAAYDTRVTILNNTANAIEYNFFGPAGASAQVQLFLSIPANQTGFLNAPHGTYTVAVTTAGSTVYVTYVLKAGVWSCKLSPDGCSAFK